MNIEAINQSAQNISDAFKFFTDETVKSNDKLAKYEAELSPAKYGAKAKKLFLKAEKNIVNLADSIATNSTTILTNAKEFADNTAKAMGMVGIFPINGEIQKPEDTLANLTSLATGAGTLGIKIAEIAASVIKYPNTDTVVAAHKKMIEHSESLIKLSGYIDSTMEEIKSIGSDDAEDE